MNILICIGRLYMGGIEKYALDLALGLKAKGHEVRLLVFFKIKNAEKVVMLRASGIDIYELNLKSGRDPNLVLSFYKVIRSYKADVIHLNALPLLAVVNLAFTKARAVYTIHQLSNIKFIAQLFSPFINGVIAISHGVKSILQKEQKIFADSKWKVINNGVESVGKKVSPPAEEITLILASRLAQDKRPDDAIDIMIYLAENSNKKYRLVLVGEGDTNDREYLASIKQKISYHNLEDKIDFKGWQEQVIPYLSRSHALLMLSRLECFPYTVLEAFSVGLPVVSYPVKGGLLDIHENNSTGIVSGSHNAIELAKQIDELFSQPDRWLSMSEQAYTRSKKFLISSMVDSTEEFYKELINKN